MARTQRVNFRDIEEQEYGSDFSYLAEGTRPGEGEVSADNTDKEDEE